MKPSWKEKWVNALRSGKYKQTRGNLQDGDGFCCLGVLCDLVDSEAWEEVELCSIRSFLGADTDGRGFAVSDMPPPSVLLTTGLEDPSIYATLNDEDKYTFEQIADEIEANE